jgi:hypothetical protein
MCSSQNFQCAALTPSKRDMATHCRTAHIASAAVSKPNIHMLLTMSSQVAFAAAESCQHQVHTGDCICQHLVT